MFDFTAFQLPNSVALAAVATLGYLLGLARSRSRSEGSLRSRSELRRASSVARELEKIAWSVRGSISRHHARLAHFKRQISEFQRHDKDVETLKSLAREAEQILTPTIRLASQIASAYDRIREQTDHLTDLAATRTDPLTGIANRQLVDETVASQFAAMWRYHTGFAAALFDIDQFHRINDVDGTLHGDQVLQQLAAILTDIARETDLVARFSGQTFIAIMPQTDLEGACYFAERYREAVERLQKVTISGGVTTALDGDDAGQLLLRLEESLAAAKHSGGNAVYRHDGIQIELAVESATSELIPC